MSMPHHIGRYRIDRRIGSGAFATVWLAYDEALHSEVAIKVLADNWSHRLDLRQRFVDEARLLRRADSDRLVRVFDIGELDDGRPYFVMTHADRGSLADRLEPAGMPPEVALRHTVDIARSAAVLHALGVIHRDLKPSNVLFRTNGSSERLLVADLGLAKEVAHASGFTVAAGSPGYMSPEQARPGGGIDIRADVYAIGAVAYHMLTGTPPVPANSVQGVPAALSAGPVPPSTRRPTLPRALDAVLRRALDPDPRQRFASAADLAEALSAVLARRPTSPRSHAARPATPEVGSAHVGNPARPRPRDRTRRRRGTARRLGALAVALGCGMGLLAGSTPAASSAPGQTVRVADVTGSVSVAVPAAWAGEIRDAGWDTGVLGDAHGHGPGLLVSADLSRWRDPKASTPGVFLGASTGLADVRPGQVSTLLVHPHCVKMRSRSYRHRHLSGVIQYWEHCGGTATSYRDVVLVDPGHYGVYAQIKQGGGSDRTTTVLDSIRVSLPR